MVAWLKARLRAFQDSYDPEENELGSSPALIVCITAALLATIATLTWVPSVAAEARLKWPAIPILLTVTAAALSHTAWRHHCRGTFGSIASLCGSLCWYLALIYLALHTSEGYAIGFSVAYALAALFVTARLYGLTLLGGLAFTLPIAAFVPWCTPPASVVLVLWAGLVLSLLASHLTRQRYELFRRKRRLEQALTVADQVADESLQAALATMLLSLGHFLHELRNHQTAMATNLTYLATAEDLSDEAREAVEDIQQAQAAEQRLVACTLDELRQRAKSEITTFSINEVLSGVGAELKGAIPVILELSEPDALLVGNPEHLKLVLHNLLRNAIQAGAGRARVEAKFDAAQGLATLVVHDDGPGISPSRRSTLFEPFDVSSKAQGTGLGLYLCRRYVGLFGGTVSVAESPLGGAAFEIRLPGKATLRDSVMLRLAKRTPRAQNDVQA